MTRSNPQFIISYEGDLAQAARNGWPAGTDYAQSQADFPLADHLHPCIKGIREQLFSENVIVAVQPSLAAALDWLSQRFQLDTDQEDPAGWPYPDAEDDRILIWEVSDEGPAHVVWHCSGWHFVPDCSGFVPDGLAQGWLPGQSISLIQAAVGNY